jgi:hypothetical protein
VWLVDESTLDAPHHHAGTEARARHEYRRKSQFFSYSSVGETVAEVGCPLLLVGSRSGGGVRGRGRRRHVG